jgi:hypothetical protein
MRSAPRTVLDYTEYWYATDTFWTKLLSLTPAAGIFEKHHITSRCPYCDSKVKVFTLAPPDTQVVPDFDDIDDSGDRRAVEIRGCSSCGWWYELFHKYNLHHPDRTRIRRTISILREFRPDAADLPLTTLKLALAKRPGLLNLIYPERLERLVASVLADFYDVEVCVLGRSGDGGIDLVYVDAAIPYAIQIKRRLDPMASEGVELVREVLGACILNGFKNAKIITTAKKFTRGAARAAEKAIGIRALNSFDLIARDRFLELFRYRGSTHRFPWQRRIESWREVYEITDVPIRPSSGEKGHKSNC